MPLKAPPVPAYQWSGCYAGLNVGGGTSGTNFGSTIDPGTYLAAGDAATVAGSGGGGANADGLLGGGQLGCNWQTGTLVSAPGRRLRLLPQQSQLQQQHQHAEPTATLFAISQSLTTNYLATVRPRIGIGADRNLAYLTGGVAFTRISYTESYADGATFPRVPAPRTLRDRWSAGPPAPAGNTRLPTIGRSRPNICSRAFRQTNATGAITDVLAASNALRGSSDLVIQLVRAGVNFKF